MKIDSNDPRLTAYALGELAEVDRIAFEADLAADPEARQEVARIRGAAGILKAKLEAEPCPRLEPEQRRAIHDRIAPAEPETRGQFGWFPWLAIAAVLVVSAVILLPATRVNIGTLARNDSPLPGAGPDHSIVPARPSPVIMMSSPAITTKNRNGQKLTTTGPTPGNLLAGNAVTLSVDESLTNAKLVASNDGMLHSSGVIAGDSRGTGGGKAGAVDSVHLSVTTLDNTERSGNSSFSKSAQDKPLAFMPPASGNGVPPAPAVPPASPPPQPTRNTTVVMSKKATGNGVRGGVSHIVSASAEGSAQPQRADETSSRFDHVAELQSSRSRQLHTEIGENVPLSPAAPVPGRGFGSRTGPANAPGTESYTPVYENPFSTVTDQPLSTFGLDVDTASYANIRRFLLNNQLPPRDAVRIEEMLNYFTYDYPAPRGSDPFALYVEMGECPWNPAHQLALVGLKAKDVTPRQQPPLNLVFLIDISGSMGHPNKLTLIKQAFRLLVPQLTERDSVSIVVYADNSRVVLTSTSGDQHRRIIDAIESLEARGATNGGDGIQNAYAQATENFIKGGINRVILCTDGDFNVGITDQAQLVRLIEQQAQSGVFLNVFGFGMGNLKDSTMQKLANKGNGQYAYIDDIDEARKVLVDQARATLITVAEDVKLQVEFNPAHVQAYRLIGYEKRALAARDFNNDRKDAGEMGAGHTVTALYEIVPAGEVTGEPGVDPLKYQPAKNRSAIAAGGEWATVKLRYKEPNAATSQLLTAALKNQQLRWRTASDDFQFAAAVATFGMVLRDSPHKADANLGLALELAEAGRGRDAKGYRSEFIDLVKRAGQRAR